MRRRVRVVVGLFWFAAASSLFAEEPSAKIDANSADAASAPAAQPIEVTSETVRAAIGKATGYLLKNQNADGSWGSPKNPAHEFWSNPETHKAWTVATTALCCMAVRQAGDGAELASAYDRGIDYILANADVKRPSDWDCDNTWAYVYGLPATVEALGLERYRGSAKRDEIRRVAQGLVESLAAYQSPDGGWGYYDRGDSVTRRPAWATSFMTAVGVLGLLDAKEEGLEVDAKLLERAVRAVKRCRLPSGAYTYSVEAIPSPVHSEWIDQIKGSLGRIQVCNLALLRAGEPISDAELERGLEYFFKEHRFLDIARMKPVPHEAYYLNSGYFYFFGHYYAAQVIKALPEPNQGKWWPKLQREILKTQEKDGSMWDFYLNSYHRPYGAAYGVMTLLHSRPIDRPAR